MLDIEQAISLLKGNPVANLDDVYHITKFWATRKTKNGEIQELLIEIRDAGPAQSQRYMVIATVVEDGEAVLNSDGYPLSVSGNSYPTLTAAIDGVHWFNLA